MKLSKRMKSFIANDFVKKVQSYAIERSKGAAVPLPVLNSCLPKTVLRQITMLAGKTTFIRDSLPDDNWGYLIYLAFFTVDQRAQPLLFHHFPLLKQSHNIRRGGLNIYKIDGWVTHVVTGIFISNICIPEGTPPKTIQNKNLQFRKSFGHTLPRLYKKLDRNDLLIFRLGSLIHDLGVIQEVENHDLHGEHFVSPALAELQITDQWLKSQSYSWNLRSITEALRIFVTQHTFLSKIFNVYGEKKVKQTLLHSFNSRNLIVNSWCQKKSIVSLGLFTIGDIASVRETLLTNERLDRLIKCIRISSRKLKDPLPLTNSRAYDKERIRELLEISDLRLWENTLEKNGVNPKHLYKILGKVQDMRYFTTYLKQLKTIQAKMLFLLRLLTFLESNKDWRKRSFREIEFSATIKMSDIEQLCMPDSTDYFEALHRMTSISIKKDIVLARIDSNK